MKLFNLMVAFTATALAVCSNPNRANAESIMFFQPQQTNQTEIFADQNVNINEVITHYLHLKNALSVDNTKEAATAGGQLHAALLSLGKQSMSDAQKKAFADIASDAEENAEHISQSAGNIKHQREHFQNLSGDIYDLVKAFGSSQTLYKDYCPMAKASWISEVKNIKNPYYGKSMPTCGMVKETISKQ